MPRSLSDEELLEVFVNFLKVNRSYSSYKRGMEEEFYKYSELYMSTSQYQLKIRFLIRNAFSWPDDKIKWIRLDKMWIDFIHEQGLISILGYERKICSHKAANYLGVTFS